MSKEDKGKPVLRKGESIGAIDRSDRVFQQGEYWYFRTREDVKIGPFDSRDIAIKGVNDYVGFAIDADPETLNSLAK